MNRHKSDYEAFRRRHKLVRTAPGTMAVLGIALALALLRSFFS